MAREVRQTTTFRRGEIGAKRVRVIEPDPFFNGFIQADEALYYGDGVCKRPPIEYISRYFFGNADQEVLVLNAPAKKGEREIKVLAFKNSTGWDLFYVKNQKIELVEPRVCGTIVDVQGEGARIIIETDADLDVGQFYELYANEQALDTVVITQLISGRRYAAEALVGEKLPYVKGEYKLCKIKRGTTTLDLTYNDSIPFFGHTLYLRDTNSYAVDPDGNISTAPTLPSGVPAVSTLTGKSITVHRNVVATALPAANGGVEVKLSYEVAGANQGSSSILQPYYGSEVYWVRDGSKGLVISTNEGIFLATIDVAAGSTAFNITNITRVTYRQSSTVKPVSHRDFILFLDAGRRTVMFVGFDRFEVNAVVETLASVIDLLSTGDYVTQLEVLHFNDIAVLLLVSSLGVCVAGNIQMQDKDSTGSLSYSRWFTSYNTKVLSVFRQGERNDAVLWLGNIGGQGFIGCLSEQPAPMFRNLKENRDPHLDFYNTITSEKLLGTKPPLVADVRSLDGAVAVVTTVDFFTPLHKGVVIRDKINSIVIETVIDARTVRGYVVNNTGGQRSTQDYPLGTRLIFSDYSLEFISVVGLSYLYFLARRGNKVVGVKDGKTVTTDRVFTDNILQFSERIGDKVTVGIPYQLNLITAPLTFQGRFVSFKGNIEVAVETLGYDKPFYFLQIYDQDMPPVRAAVERTQQLTRDEFFRHTITSVPCLSTSRPMVRLFCDSAYPIFISALSVSVGVSDV